MKLNITKFIPLNLMDAIKERNTVVPLYINNGIVITEKNDNSHQIGYVYYNTEKGIKEYKRRRYIKPAIENEIKNNNGYYLNQLLK